MAEDELLHKSCPGEVTWKAEGTEGRTLLASGAKRNVTTGLSGTESTCIAKHLSYASKTLKIMSSLAVIVPLEVCAQETREEKELIQGRSL